MNRNRWERKLVTEARKKPSWLSKWLKRCAVVGLIGGSIYVIDLTINDDLNLLTDRFRTKLTDQERLDRPHLVILGSGWGALSMIRKLQTDKFNVTVVSPRNYFLFTPLLPSTSAGTVEVRSIMEPIRYFLNRSQAQDAKFIEAEVTSVDPVTKKVRCVDNSAVQGKVREFELDYDQLVVAVGAETATFNTPGVKENAIYLRDVSDTLKLRNRIMDCFETAVIPGQPVEDIKRLLSFVIVGGGPAGVETVAEINDWLNSDLRTAFPEVSEHVKIQLVEALPHILSMFEADLIEFVEGKFKQNPSVQLRTKSMVTEVKPNAITVKSAETGELSEIPYGALLWVTGNTLRPLTRQIMSAIGPEKGQTSRRGIAVDGQLKVKGAEGMWALGDCSDTSLPATAQVASQSGKFLGKLFNDNAEAMYEDLKATRAPKATATPTTADTALTPAPTPTPTPSAALSTALQQYPSFMYQHFGAFAYVGDYTAIMELRKDNKIKSSGFGTFFWWRSVYLSKLLSVRNRTSVAIDWLKAFIFGRDLSRG